jgi:hypothetical protein
MQQCPWTELVVSVELGAAAGGAPRAGAAPGSAAGVLCVLRLKAMPVPDGYPEGLQGVAQWPQLPHPGEPGAATRTADGGARAPRPSHGAPLRWPAEGSCCEAGRGSVACAQTHAGVLRSAPVYALKTDAPTGEN